MRLFSILNHPKNRIPAFRYFATGKQINFGNDGRSKMLSGVQKISRAVSVTLGPKGRNVAIDQSFGTCKITKDGVTVAKAIDLPDPIENMGAQLIKKVASQTNDAAGDGTTTATVLASSIYAEGLKAVAAGLNPIGIQRGISRATKIVSEELRKNAKAISDDEISKVATISANSSSIGSLIASAMKKVGKKGVITVENGQKMDDQLEVVQGIKFDRGFVNPYLAFDLKRNVTEFSAPYVFVTSMKLSSADEMIAILDPLRATGRPLLIIADDIESDALSTIIVNRLRTGIKVCAVKAPGFGDNRTEMLKDIAIATGAKLYDEHCGLSIAKDFTMDHCGTCEKVEVTKDSTLIMEGKGDLASKKDRVEQIRLQIDAEDCSEYEKEKLEERLAKLTDGIAVIKVGGGSELEVNEKKDRVIDALNATKAAVAEGIVPGGGVALLYASNSLKSNSNSLTSDEEYGVKIVKNALRIPARIILDNAGIEGAVAIGSLLKESNGATDVKIGVDANDGKTADMVKAGIIDPVMVTLSALSDASSIAGTMVTTEAIISDIPAPKGSSMANNGLNMPGGMGGDMGME